MGTALRTTPVAYWLQVCRAHIRTPHIKRADLGGDGQSVPFEQALSNLAHAYLKDRAPQLLDHELGFQLIEKNEDNDRAVGIFGFRVGRQLLYVPVFFLNGELKGHELLYLKESDTFVPLKENWINYVLNRKPNIIGEEVTPNIAQLGVEQPNMDMFRESPGKWASDTPAWLQPALPGLMYALGRVVARPLHVPGLLKENADAAFKFVEMLNAFPRLARPIVELYGADTVKQAIELAKTAGCSGKSHSMKKKKKRRRTSIMPVQKSKEAAARELRDSKLKIRIYDDTTVLRASMSSAGLTEKEAQTLKRDGFIISDERTDDEVSKAYQVEEPLALRNPDATGIYNVLCRPDDFKRCLYIHSPYNSRGTKPNAVVVQLEDGNKPWTETHSGNIFVSEDGIEETDDDYPTWFKNQQGVTDLQEGGMYVIVAPNGQGTGVFEVRKQLPAEGEEKCYAVWWQNRWARRPDYLPPIAERYHDYTCGYDGPETLSLNRIKGSKFVARLSCLYAPQGAKCIAVKSPPKPKKDALRYGELTPISDYAASSDPPALRPGNLADLQVGIYKTSEELRVFNSGAEAIINNTRMAPKAALITLVRDYGLREKAAREILKRANLQRGYKCRIKVAQPYMDTGMMAPPFPDQYMGTDNIMGSGLPTQFGPDEQEVAVPGLEAAQYGPPMSGPPEPYMANQIMQAAQTGQKEVLDTSVLGNLLKATQNDTLIERHLSDLMKGLDSLGRLLFNLYWHHDKFEDRYGENSLPELTDAMRNAFESLGDVTLELKQKTVEPYPDEGVDSFIGDEDY
jgi:hypothetical protein